MKTKFHTLYSPAPDAGIDFSKSPSLTRQEFVKEADIGTLVSRFSKTGSFYDPLTAVKGSFRVPTFIDAASVPRFSEACDVLRDADAAFGSLPRSVRDRFNGSLLAFVSYLDTPEGLKEYSSLFAPKVQDDPKQTKLPLESEKAPVVTQPAQPEPVKK